MATTSEKDELPELLTESSALSRIQSRCKPPSLSVSAISAPDAPVVLHLREQDRELEEEPIANQSFQPTYDVEKAVGRVEDKEIVLLTRDDEPYRDSSISSVVQIDRDPNLVEWEGENDPQTPQNWKRSRKWIAIALGKSPLVLQVAGLRADFGFQSLLLHSCLL